MIKGWEHLRFWKHARWEVEGKVLKNCGSHHDQLPIVLPIETNWYRALELTPFKEVKCVILGQDPYPTPGHAMGLAFSVYPHVSPLPRSLRNIFREYVNDLGYPLPRTGDLTAWAEKGVLLLNSCLTVEAGKPGSHRGIGWEKLTYEILKSLAERTRPVERVLGETPILLQRDSPVFVLWGKSAQEYKGALRGSRLVCSPHPSPLSAAKGFFGSKPFSRVNEILTAEGKKPLDWKLR